MIRKMLFFSLIILFCSSIGCSEKISKDIEDKSIPNEIIDTSNRDYIVDEGIEGFIKEVYNILNLEKYEIYRIEDEMNIDFYFTEDVERSDIRNSKNVATEVFVWKKCFPIGGPCPYDFYGLEDWKKVNYRVYIGKRKIIEQKIYKKKVVILKTEYFEDTDIELQSRIIETSEMKEFKTKIKRKYWWGIKDITFEKSFKGNVLFVKLKGRKKYKDNDIKSIKKLIEQDLAVKLEQASTQIYGMNMDYLGIVAQFYFKDQKYYEESYHNGEEKKFWFSEYWGNHKYFDYNN